MKTLLRGTAAYAVFSNDARSGKLSHAYMLQLNDAGNLRAALKIFALAFFGLDENTTDGRRIASENLTDCRIYPDEGKKLTAEGVSALIADTALHPIERDKKLYIISGFEQASPLLQNKLLKTLEEPPRGVYFLLGVTTAAPVLDTVKSRVKTLNIPPFSEEEILSALKRKGDNPLNAEAAKSCGGIFGAAENMVGGGWFEDVRNAAREISGVTRVSEVGALAIKYGDTKYKQELLSELSLLYHEMLTSCAAGGECGLCAPALMYAIESVDRAAADVKFNAFFQGLLYDLMLRIIEENDKWSKLQA